eukprot:131498-Rhodomonas_salina.2
MAVPQPPRTSGTAYPSAGQRVAKARLPTGATPATDRAYGATRWPTCLAATCSPSIGYGNTRHSVWRYAHGTDVLARGTYLWWSSSCGTVVFVRRYYSRGTEAFVRTAVLLAGVYLKEHDIGCQLSAFMKDLHLPLGQ